jgi:hypothetical protein
MPDLSSKQQWQVGTDLAKLIEPFPLDQRLLLLIAGLYGESRAQGYNPSSLIDLVTRVVLVHDQGQLIATPGADLGALCPTCRRAL